VNRRTRVRYYIWWYWDWICKSRSVEGMRLVASRFVATWPKLTRSCVGCKPGNKKWKENHFIMWLQLAVLRFPWPYCAHSSITPFPSTPEHPWRPTLELSRWTSLPVQTGYNMNPKTEETRTDCVKRSHFFILYICSFLGRLFQ